jgi:hypothetical protein
LFLYVHRFCSDRVKFRRKADSACQQPQVEIPVPGRGYWAKLAVGKPAKRQALREFMDAPHVRRLKTSLTPKPTIDSADSELAQIAAVESKPIALKTEPHEFVRSSEGRLKKARRPSACR